MRAASFVINRLMVLWLVVCGLLAYLVPGPFLPLNHWVSYLLGGVILVMSLTTTTEAFAGVFVRPKALIAGFFIKWVTVPLAGFLAASLVYAHQSQLAAGTVLDGSVPAGVSSNLFAYIGHGSVPLAITLTFIHTVLSPLITPSLTQLLASRFVTVNFLALLTQMLEIVIVPVALGLAIHYGVGHERMRRVEPVLPMASAILLYLIVLGLISPASRTIHANLRWIPVVVATTTALIIVNLAVAYLLAKVLGLSEPQARSIMFDTGVYNSGLGAVLAGTNFGAFAALPALMNATMNLIIGAILAAILQNRPVPAEAVATPPAGAAAGAGRS